MKEKLRTLFQQKFNPIEYRKVVLQNLLHAQQLLSQPQFLEETNDGDRIYGLGYLTDADGKQIGLYYTDVVNSDVRRKRVGFRQMMKKYTDFGVDAAIAVFADKEHWRLSYMSDLKGGETSAKRFSYILGDLNGQYNTPVNRLAKLGTQVPRLRLKDIFEAFSVDALSDEFFDLYRDHYADIVEYITGKRMVKVDNKWVEKDIHAPLLSVYKQLTGVENADKIVRDYVKKMMGRIVFLHFLQKKGWLNGDVNFMRHTFGGNESCQDDFLEKILEPLFFGFLNTRKEDRAKLFDNHPNWDKNLLTIWEKIPYLNGGLFEQDEVDNLNIRLPRSMFDDLFTFLAEYNFTVDENDPDDAEVGVDPEMLGKIFESLLEDNKAKGAFYTPKEIVRYMCKESLIAYLSSRVSELPCPAGRNLVNLVDSADASNCERSKANNNLQDSQDFASETSRSIRKFVEHHEFPSELEPYRDTLDAALRNVKICDPAIGSGAFPMGLLNELWRCREALKDAADTSERCDLSNTVQAKRSAVTSTKKTLRAGGTRPQTRVELKKQIIENNIYGVDIERGAIDIARLRFWLSIVVDAEEPEPLPNFDYKFMQGNSLIESYKGIDLSRISNRLRGGQSKSTQLLLGLDSDFSKKNLQRLMRDYFSVTDHKQKASMRQAINDEVKRLITDFIGGTSTDLDKLDPSANQDFFLWHTWFKDIFDNGGFDIVIGNPPYLESRSPDFQEELKTALQKEVSKNRPSEQKHFPRGADLLIYFFELSFRILSKNGQSVLITENAWLSTDYGKLFQDFLINKCIINGIIDSDYKYFETADINTVITFIRNKDKRDMVVPIRFYHSHGNLNDYPCNTLSSQETENVSVKQFYSDDKFLASYKWGVIDKSDKRLIDIMETLFEKENRSLSKRISIGQGLNITKNNIVYHETHNVVPYYTSEEGPKYVWTESNCYVNPNVASSSRKKPLLILPRGLGTHFCCINRCGGYSSSYVEIYGDIAEQDLLNIWLFCNSSLLWLLREVTGRTNLGGGMLKAEATDLRCIPICYEFKVIDKISNLAYQLTNYPMSTNLIETLDDHYHKEIDEIVLSALNLKEEKDYIYQQLIKMVSNRMKKSKCK